MWESSIFHEINPSSPPIKGGSLLLIWSSNTREHNMTRREEPHSYLSSLASSSVGREWVRVKKYQSCLLHPLVYSGPLVHWLLSTSTSTNWILLGIKVHIYLWWWVLL
jgi:hypothetical protein